MPHVVYEEMKFLFDRSPDPDLERIARAFNRFYSTSGWTISDTHGHHPTLKAATGQSLTKRSRVSLAVGRCAYGLAQEAPHTLVVLVSSDRAMLQRIYDIQASNLCAITGQALLQWCRTGQRPIAVSQKLQRLRSTGAYPGTVSPMRTSPSRITSPKPVSGRYTASTSASRTQPSSARSSTSRKITTVIREARSMPSFVPQLISIGISFAALALAGWLLLFIVQQSGLQLDNLWQPEGKGLAQTMYYS